MSKNKDYFAYPVPFVWELKQLGMQPYRTNRRLEDKIRFLFSHPRFKHHKVFTDAAEHGSKQLVSDMAVRAVAIMRHFLKYPQQYGHNAENIRLQLFVRMWKQTYRHQLLQGKIVKKYLSARIELLRIEQGLIEELLRTIEEEDFVQNGDDMVKVREGVGLRERRKPTEKIKGLRDGNKYFEYLCSFE